jgi:hypothetical protein
MVCVHAHVSVCMYVCMHVHVYTIRGFACTSSVRSTFVAAVRIALICYLLHQSACMYAIDVCSRARAFCYISEHLIQVMCVHAYSHVVMCTYNKGTCGYMYIYIYIHHLQFFRQYFHIFCRYLHTHTQAKEPDTACVMPTCTGIGPLLVHVSELTSWALGYSYKHTHSMKTHTHTTCTHTHTHTHTHRSTYTHEYVRE